MTTPLAPPANTPPASNLRGKVAFITGAARGMGRSHAGRLAGAGVQVIAVDICRQIDTVGYPMSTSADLDETVRQVEAAGGQIVALQGDVRESAELQAALQRGVEAFGRLDIVVANAGIASAGAAGTDDEL